MTTEIDSLFVSMVLGEACSEAKLKDIVLNANEPALLDIFNSVRIINMLRRAGFYGREVGAHFNKALFNELTAVFSSAKDYKQEKISNYTTWLKKMDTLFMTFDFSYYDHEINKMIFKRNQFAKSYSHNNFTELLAFVQNSECGYNNDQINALYIRELRGANYLSQNTINLDMVPISTIKTLLANILYKYKIPIDLSECNVIVSSNGPPRFIYHIKDNTTSLYLCETSDISSAFHEFGHYIHHRIIGNSTFKSSKIGSVIISEIFAVLFEMLSCAHYLGNSSSVHAHYSWQACWFKALSDFECKLYTETASRHSFFTDCLIENFTGSYDGHAYYNRMWLTQTHIFSSPGYCYYYYIALVVAINLFTKMTSKDCITYSIHKLFVGNSELNSIRLIDKLMNIK